MRFVMTGCVVGLALWTSGCWDIVDGNGDAARETRPLPAGITAIEADGPIFAEVRIASDIVSPTVVVKGDSNLLGHVRSEVAGEILQVWLDADVRSRTPLRLLVQLPTLRSIELDGSGTLAVQGVQGDTLAVKLGGSGTVAVRGSVETASLELRGSGVIDANELRASTAAVELDGSGAALVCATTRLDVELDGSGHVEVACDPADIQADVDGSGWVVRQ